MTPDHDTGSVIDDVNKAVHELAQQLFESDFRLTALYPQGTLFSDVCEEIERFVLKHAKFYAENDGTYALHANYTLEHVKVSSDVYKTIKVMQALLEP